MKNSDFEIMPPKVDLVVTSVEVKVAGSAPQAFAFSGHKCEVDVNYGDLVVSAASDADGRRLRLRTKPRPLHEDFDVSTDGRIFTSKNGSNSITQVQVRRNGHPMLELTPASQKTKVTIHYQ